MGRSSEKKRIAILGGGMAGVVAAFELTHTPALRERHHVTLYQPGWRLGGKGASGRNRRAGMRIEEHGLHVWGGYYENAFQVLRGCYEELGRRPGEPLVTWTEAFQKKSFLTLQEHVRGRWIPWNLKMPENDAVPGDGRVVPGIDEYLKLLASAAMDLLSGAHRGAGSAPRPAAPTGLFSVLRRALPALLAARGGGAAMGALEAIRSAVGSALREGVERSDTARRMWILLDLTLAQLRGLVVDRVATRGFAALDGEDWTDWLRRHGASRLALHSPLVRAVYDTVFAYEAGDPRRPRLSAGCAQHALLRFVFTYKGAFFWELRGGMGDVVFAPLYEVLARRGVDFRFFHAASHLRLSSDRRSVAGVRLVRQARTLGGRYEPLIQFRGLPCWPSEPLHGQLVNGPELERAGVDFESPWSRPPGAEELELRAGEDFDAVVLAVPLGALPPICAELSAADERWREMFARMGTARTQALQLWLGPDTRTLGWTAPRTILSGYAQPLNTWADMSHVLEWEDWPRGRVGSLAYFCGPMAELPPGDASSGADFPGLAREQVFATAREWLEANAGRLWPAAVERGTSKLDWSLLSDPEGRTGAERLRAQYWRANVAPSERYVLSLPGTARYRLAPGESGFDNLVLAGDWTANGFNLGTVEAAAISGRKAAQALCGHPARIVGE